MRKNTIPITIVALPLLAVASTMLAGCSSDEGMLSDEEKIQKMHQGRAEYEQAMKGGNPATQTPSSTGN